MQGKGIQAAKCTCRHKLGFWAALSAVPDLKNWVCIPCRRGENLEQDKSGRSLSLLSSILVWPHVTHRLAEALNMEKEAQLVNSE